MPGQTLIEVVVILAASVILLTALTTVIVSSLDSSTFSKNQNQASQYAQQGIEIVRVARPTPDKTYCLGSDGILTEACDGRANIDNFKRDVSVLSDKCGTDVVSGVNEISVTVSWTDGKCAQGQAFCHNVKLVSCQEE